MFRKFRFDKNAVRKIVRDETVDVFETLKKRLIMSDGKSIDDNPIEEMYRDYMNSWKVRFLEDGGVIRGEVFCDSKVSGLWPYYEYGSGSEKVVMKPHLRPVDSYLERRFWVISKKILNAVK